MGKGGCVRVIEAEEVRGNDPVEYFLSPTSGDPEGVMAMEVPQNEEISGGGKNGGRKGVGSAVRWGGANRGGGAYTLKNESEEKLLREMLTNT